MPINHLQSFWDVPVGTGDIGSDRRAQVAKVALALNENPDVIFASSSGGYTDAELPELSLIIRIGVEPQSLKGAIEEALAAQKVSVEPVLKDDVRYYDFGKRELDNFAAAAHVPDLGSAHAAIDELARLRYQPHDGPTPSAADVLASFAGADSFANISPSQISENFSIGTPRFQQLRGARGDAIEQHIKGLSNTFASLKKETNSNAATAIMVGGGLITVGSKMWTLYSAIQTAGSVTALVSQLIAAVGGIVALGAIIAVIAIAFGLLWIFLKDALNLCLVVNSRNDLTFTNDYIKNGERYTIVQSLPQAAANPANKPGAVPCGFFVYRKYNIGRGGPSAKDEADHAEPIPPVPSPRLPIGFYGSCMGMAFRFSTGQRFAVGMDCPNTIIGGTNSIVITTRSAQDAAQLANDNGTADQSITVGPYKCTVRRAAALGSVNYGLCLIE
ncbi:hypothetical protein C2E23DRAFT_859026 [Lenzites betulinus]|nr:hypothetical protein C2E23DRAFT_859026 [Lenzites betulinus]